MASGVRPKMASKATGPGAAGASSVRKGIRPSRRPAASARRVPSGPVTAEAGARRATATMPAPATTASCRTLERGVVADGVVDGARGRLDVDDALRPFLAVADRHDDVADVGA